MIFMTGDTHGHIDWAKINTKNFPIQSELTKEDYVIILGDTGIVWDGAKSDKYIQRSYNDRKFTTLFIDGNHCNFDKLNAYPIEEWNGGKIHRISDSIIHLMRGQVFTIEGKKFFTLGGGVSIDKQHREEGVSWWADEVPSKEELEESTKNLSKVNYEVDYVLTHSAPKRFICELSVSKQNKEYECELDFYLDNLYDNLKFEQWLCGHYHYDKIVTDKFRCLFDDILSEGM